MIMFVSFIFQFEQFVVAQCSNCSQMVRHVFKLQSFTTMYKSCTINIFDCSVFTRWFLAIGWPWAKLNKHRYSHILLCINLAHGCNQYFGLQCVHRMFWLSAGYWLYMVQKQYTSRHSHILIYTKVAHGYKEYFGHCTQCVHNLATWHRLTD